MNQPASEKKETPKLPVESLKRTELKSTVMAKKAERKIYAEPPRPDPPKPVVAVTKPEDTEDSRTEGVGGETENSGSGSSKENKAPTKSRTSERALEGRQRTVAVGHQRKTRP